MDRLNAQLIDIEQVFVLEFDVLLFVVHLTKPKEVVHVPLPQEPSQEVPENLLYLLLLLTLGSHQHPQMCDSENLFVLYRVVFLKFCEITAILSTKTLKGPSIIAAQKALNSSFTYIGTDILLVVWGRALSWKDIRLS